MIHRRDAQDAEEESVNCRAGCAGPEEGEDSGWLGLSPDFIGAKPRSFGRRTNRGVVLMRSGHLRSHTDTGCQREKAIASALADS